MSDPRNTLVIMIEDDHKDVAVGVMVGIGEGGGFTEAVCLKPGAEDPAPTYQTPATHWFSHYDWITEERATWLRAMKQGTIPTEYVDVSEATVQIAWGEDDLPTLVAAQTAMSTGLSCLYSELTAQQAGVYNATNHIAAWLDSQGLMIRPGIEI